MYYAGEQNVPGAPGNLNPYGNLAGIQLPLPGQLNRGGAFRQPGYRPGGGVEEVPVRPMQPSDYQGQPAIPTQGIPFAQLLNGQVPMGNASFFAGPQYGQQYLQQLPAGFQNKMVS
jgi:hypothetical protein